VVLLFSYSFTAIEGGLIPNRSTLPETVDAQNAKAYDRRNFKNEEGCLSYALTEEDR
jgi:hypothetical protein